MPAVSEGRIADLLAPYLAGGPQLDERLLPQIGRYLDLLLLWNARINLTSIRDPETLLQRQVGESLFAARFVGDARSLLDFGSGGGIPGVPLQLAYPTLQVTLAESQGKKASFLREAVRHLGLPSEVWSSRVECKPANCLFDIVAMRAVDQTAAMLPVAQARVASGGRILRYVSERDEGALEGWRVVSDRAVPLSKGRLVCLESLDERRSTWNVSMGVPRGTSA